LGAPILGQFHRGAGELAVLLELGLEQFEQREGVGRGTGETGQDLAVAAEPAHLAGVALHHGVAERDLAVAGDDDLAVAAHRHDGRGVERTGILAGVHAGLRGLFPQRWGRMEWAQGPWERALRAIAARGRSYPFFLLARGWAAS